MLTVKLSCALALASAAGLAMRISEERQASGAQAPSTSNASGSLKLDFSRTPWADLIDPKGLVLGKGAFGTASLHGLKKPCAGEVVVKTIRDCKEKFLNHEIEMLKALEHPNIVRMYSYYPRKDFCQSVPYILMEPAMAGELDKSTWKVLGGWVGRFKGWFGEGTLRGESKAKILLMAVIDSLRGLAFMHGKRILHRDLKPPNIWGLASSSACIENWSCRFVLGDLGLATEIQNDDDRTYETWGTPVYMPPEASVEGGFWTFKGDVWALGISLHEILLAWNKKQSSVLNLLFSSQETLVAAQKGILSRKKYLPVELKRLLWDMTKNNWRERPTAAEALSRAENIMRDNYNRTLPDPASSAPQCIADCEKALRQNRGQVRCAEVDL